VLFALFADEKCLGVSAAGQTGTSHRVCAHRHPADRGRSQLVGKRRDQLTKRCKASGLEDRPLGIDVIRGGLAAGQDDATNNQRVATQFVHEPLL